MKDSHSPTPGKTSGLSHYHPYSEHKKFKLGSKAELNNPELFGNIILKNTFMHDNYRPDLDNDNSFKFLKYLNSKSPSD